MADYFAGDRMSKIVSDRASFIGKHLKRAFNAQVLYVAWNRNHALRGEKNEY